MKVGILLGALGAGSLKKDIQRAMAVGIHGLQLRVVDTEIDPREISRSGREELSDYVESFGLELPALCGDLGGFADSSMLDARVSRTRAMLDMCVDLRVPVLTACAGMIPAPDSSAYAPFVDVLRDLGNYALNRDRRLALSTATEPVEKLAGFLGDVRNEGLRVNFDPGALCARGFDSHSAVNVFGKSIVHMQARDAARGSQLSAGEERPVGGGDVGFDVVMEQLLHGDYAGYLTVTHHDDATLAANVVGAVTWLKRQKAVEP